MSKMTRLAEWNARSAKAAFRFTVPYSSTPIGRYGRFAGYLHLLSALVIVIHYGGRRQRDEAKRLMAIVESRLHA